MNKLPPGKGGKGRRERIAREREGRKREKEREKGWISRAIPISGVANVGQEKPKNLPRLHVRCEIAFRRNPGTFDCFSA